MDIDVVLSGHDHVYVRSQMMNGTEVSDDVVTNNKVVAPDGTLHICANSSTGSKFYDQYVQNAEYVAYENYEKRKSAIIFSVTDNKLTLNSYFLDDMSVFDTFSILKEEEEEVDDGSLKLDSDNKAVCPHCGGEPVVWTKLTGALGELKDGAKHHYYFDSDMTINGDFLLVNSSTEVCLHLNNHTLTQTGWINAISGKVHIMDGTAGTGGIVGNHASRNTLNASWGTINIYGGTFSYEGTADLPTITMIKSSAKVNLLGGTVIGGINVTEGSDLSLNGTATVLGANGEKTGNIHVTETSTLKVNSTWTGEASVSFEALTDNTISATNGVSTGAYTGKLHSEDVAENMVCGENGGLVLKTAEQYQGMQIAIAAQNLPIPANATHGDTFVADCPACGSKDVTWTGKGGALGELSGGEHHYFLTKDIPITYGFMTLSNSAQVCLHLNGKTITQKGRINVASGTLNIMDGAAGTGAIIGYHDTYSTLNVSWGTANIYGGTFSYTGTGSQSVISLQQTSSKCNVYAGTVEEDEETTA